MEIPFTSVKVISIDEDVDRRERLISAGFPGEIVMSYLPAIDFRDRTYSQTLDFLNIKFGPYRYGRVLSASEVGCALSHKKAYRSLGSLSVDLGLILEDDVNFNIGYSWRTVENAYGEVLNELSSHEPFVVHLGCNRWEFQNARRFNGNLCIYEPEKGSIWNAHAYFVSRGAITILRSQERVENLADDWSSISETGIKIYLFDPGIFRQDRSLESRLTRFMKVNRAPLPSRFASKFKYCAKKRILKFAKQYQSRFIDFKDF
ncbi:glycosyltransferase family 25 protein [Ovoidimarina sediminis]|uniref:glycosyltransferase family 25 protein n=1 Tax=Ovoidimarina sediminis TaxID=3079856 RepID=UPI0029082C9C|nr:glycosyltransferase family 25 protein [Rhodophyticola sp. MJ-SS7]MDU8946149.1 glycosyltransferase family 25 protein [Rhodophyticola sp. MJ-SS7]